MKKSRDNINWENSGTAFVNGNVKNDNRVITINQTTKCPFFPIICFVMAFVLLLTVLFFFILTKQQGSSVCIEPVSKDVEIRIGPRGGVYYVDEQGKRQYLDREAGMKLYRKQTGKTSE